MKHLATFLTFAAVLLPAAAQQRDHLDIESEFGSFVEEDFPFFCQTVDAREFGKTPQVSNLVPRGIVVKLGDGHYGCFDPDLLRWALVWKANDDGEYLTMDGMAPGSYRLPNRKAPAGQKSLPRPLGESLAATPPLPGWSVEKTPNDHDPRDRGSSDEGEIGIGPVPAELARFSGIRLTPGGLQLEYTVGGTSVTERLRASGGKLIRRLVVAPRDEVIHFRGPEGWTAVAPSQSETVLSFDLLDGSPSSFPESPALLRPDWSQRVETTTSLSKAENAFVFDDIGLPVPNPWKRNVRLCGFDFFPDGRGAFCTFDGDIWLVEGLEEGSDKAVWQRFASGLHEPKTVCIVDEQIYVSDRNGIVRLEDTDGDGVADWYANFSNIVPQTAETREFAMDMIAAAGGGFFLAKGGQIGSTRGIANGTVVKVASDGLTYEIVSTGLRQPYLGYDPETGILTSSDQQGHWKPATPIYRIEPGRYFGFQPEKLKDKAVHPAPIDPAEVWIPHFVNQSGASQVWMKGAAKMGTLDGALIHIGYNRPEIFRVYLHEGRGQGAVVPVLEGFPAGVIKGRIHPTDGRLYLSGFEIWGTSGERISGLFRVRPGAAESWIPESVEASERGVLLTFPRPLDADLVGDLARYSVDRWNYQQTHNYGSGNFRLDGEPGQESVGVSSVKLSKDGKSLFLGIADMAPSHSLRMTYRLPAGDGTKIETAYLTIRNLDRLSLTKRGFVDDEVDLTPRAALAGAEAVEPTAALGKEVALRYGCIACHATGDSGLPAPVAGAEGAQVAVGPAWTGLWNSHRDFIDGSFIKNVDETYLRESILDPPRRVPVGYESEKTGVGMPSYLGVLKDHEIDSVILYIRELAGRK